MSADRFLNCRAIERNRVDPGKQQGGCKSVGIHPEFTEELSSFGTV